MRRLPALLHPPMLALLSLLFALPPLSMAEHGELAVEGAYAVDYLGDAPEYAGEYSGEAGDADDDELLEEDGEYSGADIIERPDNVPPDATLPAPWPAGLRLETFDGSVWNFTVDLPPGEIEQFYDPEASQQHVPVAWRRGNTVGPVLSDIVLTVYEADQNIMFSFTGLVIEEVELRLEIWSEILEGPVYIETAHEPQRWLLNRLRDPDDGEELLMLTAPYHNMYYSFGFVYPSGADRTYMWAQVRSIIDSFRIVDPQWYADTHSVAEMAEAAGLATDSGEASADAPQFVINSALTDELVVGASSGDARPAPWPDGTPLLEKWHGEWGFSLSVPDGGEFLTEEEAGVPDNEELRYPIIWSNDGDSLLVFDRMLMGYKDHGAPMSAEDFAGHVAEELGNVSMPYPQQVAGPQMIRIGGHTWTRAHLRRPQNRADVIKLFLGNGRHYYSFYFAFEQNADLALVDAQIRGIIESLMLTEEQALSR